MCCPTRGAFGKYWQQILETTKNWMPKGFVPRFMIWTVGETVTALAAETVAAVALDTITTLAPTTNNFALAGITGSLMITNSLSSQSKKVVLIAIPILFFLIEDFAGTITRFVVSMFATIGGGKLALMLTHAPEEPEYRGKMVLHTLAGITCRAITSIPSPTFVYPALVGIRTLCQTAAYNGESLIKTLCAKRDKKVVGALTPALSAALAGRFARIETRKNAYDVAMKLTPFFERGGRAFFGPTLDSIFKNEIKYLQARSKDMVQILARSLIEYTRLIHKKTIRSSTETILFLFSQSPDHPLLSTALKELEKKLHEIVISNTPISEWPVEQIGSAFVWQEDRLKHLSKVIKTEIQNFGTFLFNKNSYPDSHLQFIELMLSIHLKQFAIFLVLRHLSMDILDEPFTPDEEAQLSCILAQAVWFTLVQPLVPKPVSQILLPAATAAVKTGVDVVHLLQGHRPTNVILPGNHTEITEDYFKAPPPEPQKNPDDDYINAIEAFEPNCDYPEE